MTVLVDVYEPQEIEYLIAQSTPVSRMSLNSEGFADYLWFAVDGHRIQVERKQIMEILGGMDNVEEQLRRELSNTVEETILLIEGFCEPVAGLQMATQIWHKAKNKNIMIPGHTYNVSYTGLQAWKSQLDKAGITVVETFDYVATAMTLVALYQNSQKAEHQTLKRYIKDKIYIESYNPHILNLMSIKGCNIGEEKAKALIDRYGTFWYVVNQSPEDLAETLVGEKRLGLTTAKRLLKAIGRNV
jgi:ERCC4-type nuclease